MRRVISFLIGLAILIVAILLPTWIKDDVIIIVTIVIGLLGIIIMQRSFEEGI